MRSRGQNVIFGLGAPDPQTLNLRYRWYGGICRGDRATSCGERIFHLALSVPEIFDVEFFAHFP